MKCLFLAAGYATRLYPLTENFPKPLLKVGEKAILEWLIDDLSRTGLIDEYIVVTNHKFAQIFEEWAASRRVRITVIDDGTSTNETRLGAVKDIELGINACNVADDLLVMAGDNLLEFSLGGFVEYALAKGTTCIMRYFEPSGERLHKSGVAEIDSNDLVLSMEEKPANPKSHWCCPAFYYYKKYDLKLVSKGIAEGCGTDAPGSFIAWLCTQTAVHAWEMPGARFDIGSLDTYREAQARFAAK